MAPPGSEAKRSTSAGVNVVGTSVAAPRTQRQTPTKMITEPITWSESVAGSTRTGSGDNRHGNRGGGGLLLGRQFFSEE